MVKKNKISDLVFDDKNFNKGSEFGSSLMDKSLSKFGAGRSVLIDKNNRLIAGNKTTEKFGELGGQNVLIVDTDKNTLVAVRRNDIDIDTPEGREFALADNATAKANIVWDVARSSKNEYHPTQKPIELAARAIKNHIVKSVLDLFGGSGSTMVASDQMKVKSYLCELAEKYCDVIVSRMIKLDPTLPIKRNGKLLTDDQLKEFTANTEAK